MIIINNQPRQSPCGGEHAPFGNIRLQGPPDVVVMFALPEGAEDL